MKDISSSEHNGYPSMLSPLPFPNMHRECINCKSKKNEEAFVDSKTVCAVIMSCQFTAGMYVNPPTLHSSTSDALPNDHVNHVMVVPLPGFQKGRDIKSS
jgi:hypothetical protein